MKKSKRVLNLEAKGDFLSALIKEPIIFEKFYNPLILHIKPVMISREGYEIYNIASWNKKELMKFINLLEKLRKGKLLLIKKEKISSISIVGIHPDLTKKQKKALELAVKNGYYDYPKKIGLEELAKLNGISYSTYQAHLKKAEKKIVPFMLERL